MNKSKAVQVFSISILISGLFFLSLGTGASAAKPFYEGKTMVLIVPTNPGGGYDFYGRTIAKLMQEELAGSTFIVKNMPGAGNIIGINALYQSKPNGLTISIMNPGLISAQLVGLRGIKFDLKKLSYLGATGESPYALIVSSAKFKNLADVEKVDPFKIACAGIGTLSYVIPMMAKEMKILEHSKIMLGYRGAQAELAMMQGNIDGQWGSWAALKSFVQEGHGFPAMFVKGKPQDYQQTASIEDVVTDRKFASLIDFMDTMSATLLRCFVGPPNLPPDRLQTLRQAFKNVTQSEKYKKIMQKAGRPGGYISAERQRKLVMDSLKIPPDQIQIIKAAYGKK